MKNFNNCRNCIHKRVECGLRKKYTEYIQEMEKMMNKYPEMGYTLDCPSWIDEDIINIKNKSEINGWFKTGEGKSEPLAIKFNNGSEIKTISSDSNTRGKRAEMPIHYFDYEKITDKYEDLLNEVITDIIKNNTKTMSTDIGKAFKGIQR